MRAKEAIMALSLCMASILVIGGVAGVISFGDTPADEQLNIGEYSLIEKPEGMSPNELDIEVVEDYGSFLLVESGSGENQLDQTVDVEPLEDRNQLNIKGHQFNTEEGLPELNSELTNEEYAPGTEGLYIIDMIGPVSPEWREELESMGVEIINYQPNYAYEVVMTPELAEEVEDKFFVDWTGVYQPAFKLADDLEPGTVNIELVDDVDAELLSDFDSKANILSTVEMSEDRSRVVAEIEDESIFADIAQMEDVYYISNQMEPRLYDEMATQIIGGGLWTYDDDDNPDTAYRAHGDYGSHTNQIGYDGSGVVTAIADTGLGDGTTPNAGHDDFTGRVVGGYDFDSGSTDEGEWKDENGHGTHCAGSVGGDTYGGTGDAYYEDYYAAQGSAPETELFSARIFDDGGDWTGPSDYKEIVTVAREHGDAYVHSNSWGGSGDGAYDESDVAYDEAVRDAGDGEPMVITLAAGNDGPGGWGGGYNTIGSPGVAKNVITVGSIQNYNPNEDVEDPEAVSDFSSRGWTDDNRVKPDVMAPGEGIYSTKPDGGYQSMSGTSMANPAVAGASTAVVDWYQDQYGVKPNPSMVKALLINTAYNMDNTQSDTGENSPHIPNQDEGWGMVDLHSIVESPVDFMLEDETSLLETGQTDEYSIEYQDSNEPLKLTLTWSDDEAQSGDDPALKNDLNLEVISPSGDVYRGNNLVESWSAPGEETYDTFDTSEDGWDDVNTVENVFIRPDDLESGTYTVKVNGFDIPEDANGDGTANQDYSLVEYNAQSSDSQGPNADFTFDPSQPEVGQTVQFTDQSEGDIEEWSWDFGDEATSSQEDPTHSYDSDGTYTVELTVTDSDSETDTTSKSITVEEDVALQADFTFDPSQPEVGETVQFTDQSEGDIEEWSWDFGDEATSSQEDPTHSYDSDGTYTVELTVTDSDSETDTASKSITVEEETQEYCEVEGGDTSYDEYITNVQLNGINKDSDDDGGYADHTGSVSDPIEPEESYELSVTMSTGGYSDYISVVIDWDQDYDLSNDEVIEVGNGDSDPTTVSTEITVPSDAVEGETRMRVMQEYNGYHTDPCSDQDYGETEDYTVTIGEDGGSEPGPDADFTFDPSQPEVGETVQFTDQSEGDIEEWSWDFGDEATSSQEDPTHSYDSDGTYTVELTVTDSDSETDTTSKSITVEEDGGEDGEYCEVDGGDTSYGEYITNVQFNGINKDSDDDGGYADHTGSVSDAVEPGESYELSVTMSTGGYSDYISVVIDWDQDYDLSNDEVIEVGNGDSDPTTVSTEITVPSDAVEGETRMRVMQEYNGYHTDPCSDQDYGETEDYTVTVGEDDGGGDGGEDGEYCEVDGGDTSYGEYITNVQFNGINKDSDDDGGYADHTGSVSDAVEPGESYELTVTMSTGGYSDYISVVIDWDQDYDLSNDEVIEVGNGDNDPTTVSTEITVPSDAVEGETRMRVMQEYQGYHTDPCSDQSYGETEDYTVTVSDSSTMVEETGPEADLADTDEPLIVTGSSLEISAPIDLKTAGSTRIATE